MASGQLFTEVGVFAGHQHQSTGEDAQQIGAEQQPRPTCGGQSPLGEQQAHHTHTGGTRATAIAVPARELTASLRNLA